MSIYFDPMFRAYDIRGLYPSVVEDSKFFRLGYAVTRVWSSLEPYFFVLGWDMRPSSPNLVQSFIDGVKVGDGNVISVGPQPNPLTYFSCWRLHLKGGYITASHAPARYNGIKFIFDNGVSDLAYYKNIRKEYYRIIEAGEVVYEGMGTILFYNPVQDYLKEVGEFAPEGGAKITLETFGGMGVAVEKKIFSQLEIHTISTRQGFSPTFYGLRPEPIPDNLTELRRLTVKYRDKMNLGVAFDGDCDRAVFVDPTGQVIDASRAGIIYALEFVKKGDLVVLTPDVNSALVELLEDLGAIIRWSRIGHAYIEDAVYYHNALIGLEQSGHFYFGFKWPFSDGILATLLMLKALRKRWPSEILSDFKIPHLAKFYVNVGSDEKKYLILQSLKDEVWEKFSNVTEIFDYIQVKTDDYRLLIRVSETMPEINLVIESEKKKTIEKVKKEWVKKIRKLQKEV